MLGTTRKHVGVLVQALSWESGHQLQALVPAIQSHTRYVFVSDLFASPPAFPLESPCSSLSISESVNPTVRRYQRSNGKYFFQTTVKVRELCGTRESHHHINRVLGKDFPFLSSVITIAKMEAAFIKIVYIYTYNLR